MKVFDFDTLELISISKHIQKHNSFRFLILYPPRMGKTTTLSTIRKTISKELDSCVINKFLFIDDFMGSAKDIIDFTEDKKYICLASHTVGVDNVEEFNMLNNGTYYIQYYSKKASRYCAAMKHGTFLVLDQVKKEE